jgi:hypothetical protein
MPIVVGLRPSASRWFTSLSPASLTVRRVYAGETACSYSIRRRSSRSAWERVSPSLVPSCGSSARAPKGRRGCLPGAGARGPISEFHCAVARSLADLLAVAERHHDHRRAPGPPRSTLKSQVHVQPLLNDARVCRKGGEPSPCGPIFHDGGLLSGAMFECASSSAKSSP